MAELPAVAAGHLPGDLVARSTTRGSRPSRRRRRPALGRCRRHRSRPARCPPLPRPWRSAARICGAARRPWGRFGRSGWPSPRRSRAPARGAAGARSGCRRAGRPRCGRRLREGGTGSRRAAATATSAARPTSRGLGGDSARLGAGGPSPGSCPQQARGRCRVGRWRRRGAAPHRSTRRPSCFRCARRRRAEPSQTSPQTRPARTARRTPTRRRSPSLPATISPIDEAPPRAGPAPRQRRR